MTVTDKYGHEHYGEPTNNRCPVCGSRLVMSRIRTSEEPDTMETAGDRGILVCFCGRVFDYNGKER